MQIYTNKCAIIDLGSGLLLSSSLNLSFYLVYVASTQTLSCQHHKLKHQEMVVGWSYFFPLSGQQYTGPEKHTQACDAGNAQGPHLLHGAGLPPLALPSSLQRHDEVKQRTTPVKQDWLHSSSLPSTMHVQHFVFLFKGEM